MARVVGVVLFLAACTATPPLPSPSPSSSDGGLAPMPTLTSETSASALPPTRFPFPTQTAAPGTSSPSISPAPSMPVMPAPTVPRLSVDAALTGLLFLGPGFGSGWDVDGCPGLRFDGRTYLVQYPEGWVIRDGPSGIELVGPDGAVYAQEGDVVGVDGVVDGEGHFDCSGYVFHATDVVTTSPAPFRPYELSCGPMPRAECEIWESGILAVAAREYPGETISFIHITGRDGDYQARLTNGHLFSADVN